MSILKKIKLLLFLIFFTACNTHGFNENTTVLIRTSAGDIKVKLYDGTPIHRDNFIKLINAGVYDGVSFHRVIKDFMIQTGDTKTRLSSNVKPSDSLNTYTIPAEFNPLYFHKRGALAAARQGNDVNPEMNSSGTQFYIVQGTKYDDAGLIDAENRINANIKQANFIRIYKNIADSIKANGKIPVPAEVQEAASLKMFDFLTGYTDYKIKDDQKKIYRESGGTPRLDATYTVFGEVTEGMDIVDKIASSPTGTNDVPLSDIRIIKMKIIK